MKPFVVSFCSLFSTVTLHKTKTFQRILDNDPIETFGSSQSSIMNEQNKILCRIEALLNINVRSFVSPFGDCRVS